MFFILHHPNVGTVIDTATDWTLRRMFVPSLQKNALVKTLHKNTTETKAKLLYEYEMLTKTNSQYLLRPIHLDNTGKPYSIYYEDFQGVPLTTLREQSLSFHHVLTIAIGLANACISLHGQNLIFNNFNPQTVYIHPTSMKIKLLSSEYMTTFYNGAFTAIDTPHERSEQLPYLAPELTGRLNWQIDYRSDLYGIGAILYELLSGKKPIYAENPVQMIYEILSKKPTPINEITEHVPLMFSMIIDKLLNKNVEDRYQSAYGLKADLMLLQNKLAEQQENSLFALGEQDFTLNIALTNKLYGRERPFLKLQDIFHEVKRGDNKIVFITGKSGVGKSRFVHELKQSVLAAKGYFISSKFDQLREEIPFAPMILPIREALRQVYLEGQSSIALWKSLFKEMDLKTTEQLTTLIPELKLFSDASFEITSGNSDLTLQLNAFIFASIQKILATFAKLRRPLVIFLDDLQWTDNLTIEMLQQIIAQHRDGYLLTIAAYREEDISPVHAVFQWQRELDDYECISLLPLQQDDVRGWIEDSFNATSFNISSFSQHLYYLTNGNPLYITIAFRSYQMEQAFFYDNEKKEWLFDLSRLQQVISNDKLLSFIEQRMNNLNEDVREILQISSCFGLKFEFQHLLDLLQHSPFHLLQSLQQLIEQGFIIPLNQYYQWASAYNQEEILQDYTLQFQFVHDRIQQAAYSRLNDEDRRQLHFKIGKLLYKNGTDISDTEHLMAVVKHFNYSRELLNPGDRQQLAQWNFKLGQHVKKAGLFKNALDFFSTGLELLPADHWGKLHDLSYEIYAQLGECEFLVGRFEQSEKHLSTALTHAKNEVEMLSIYHLKTVLYVESDSITVGTDNGLEGLAVGNIRLNDKPSKGSLLLEFALLKKALRKKKDEDLLSLPPASEREVDLLIQIINNLAGSSLRLDPILTGKLMLRAMRLVLKHGSTSESSIVFINYALLLNAGFHDIKGSYRFGQLAVTMAENKNNIYLKTRIYFAYGVFLNHTHDDYDKTIDYLRKSQRYSDDLGISYITAVAACFISTAQLLQGVQLSEIQLELEQQQQIFLTNNHTLSKDYLSELALWIDTLKKEKSSLTWDYPYTIQDDDSILIMHLTLRLKMSFMLQDSKQAKDILEKLERPIKEAFTLIVTPYYYYYRALWQMEWMSSGITNFKKEYIKDIRLSIQKLQKWAKYAPQNYEHLYTLLLAEQARMRKETKEAALYYDRAIQLAHVEHFIQDEAIACERGANYYLSLKKYKEAEVYITRGIRLMKQWGASLVAKHWEQKYASILISTLPGKSANDYSFDTLTVLEATQSISQAIRMDDLLEKTLFSLIKQAGASRGYFIKKKDDFFEALATAEMQPSYLTKIEKKPLSELPSSVQAIIDYVAQTGEHVIIHNSQKDKRFTSYTEDEGITQHVQRDLKVTSFTEEDGFIQHSQRDKKGSSNTEDEGITQHVQKDLKVTSHSEEDGFIQHSQRDKRFKSRTEENGKSVLCLPIYYKGEITAILYFENNVTLHAFDDGKVELLNMLASQIAVAIENVQIYEDLEQRVEKRTKELAKMNADLKEANNRLHQNDIERKKLFSSISHELRSPITSVIGYIEAILDGIVQDEEQQMKYLTRSKERLFALNGLIQDLLDLANLEAGRIQYKFSKISVATLVQSFIEKAHPQILQKSLTFISHCQVEEDRFVLIDLARIEQIYLNLLQNALKYTRKGTIELSVETQNNTLYCAVKDTGIGIPKHDIPFVFDTYFSGSNHKGIESHGIGLAICKQIVEQHGGTIFVNSVENEGSTFTFTLPLLEYQDEE